MKFLEFLGVAIGIAFFVVCAYIYCCHIDILPSGGFRLVYCEGDWIDRLISLFRN